METLISSIKTDLSASTILKKVEIVTPRTLPDLRTSILPWAGIAPISTNEAWKTNGRKVALHTVEIYCAQWIQKFETAVIGDGALKGILDVVVDVADRVRGDTFSNYLSKPTDISGIDYSTAGYGDNYYLIVATVTLQCERIFSV